MKNKFKILNEVHVQYMDEYSSLHINTRKNTGVDEKLASANNTMKFIHVHAPVCTSTL